MQPFDADGESPLVVVTFICIPLIPSYFPTVLMPFQGDCPSRMSKRYARDTIIRPGVGFRKLSKSSHK